jgi:hypothetical protein
MLTLQLNCFCVHRQRIVLQKDLFQPAEIYIWCNETFFIVAPWCQIPKYDRYYTYYCTQYNENNVQTPKTEPRLIVRLIDRTKTQYYIDNDPFTEVAWSRKAN